jgi:sulfur carrier protein ThiS
MRVTVVLHSYLREKLPPETRGRAELELPAGSRVADVFARLGLPDKVAWAVNGQLERNPDIILQDGDELRVFRQGAGG